MTKFIFEYFSHVLRTAVYDNQPYKTDMQLYLPYLHANKHFHTNQEKETKSTLPWSNVLAHLKYSWKYWS